MKNKNTAPPIATEPKAIKGEIQTAAKGWKEEGGEEKQQTAGNAFSKAPVLEYRWFEDITA